MFIKKLAMTNIMKKMLNRVPEVTIYFWIIKIMATTVGETAADFLAFTLNLGLGVTSYIVGSLLVIARIRSEGVRKPVIFGVEDSALR